MAAAKISGIYEIVNTENSKRYVGSSVDIRRRWAQHRARLNSGEHHCPPLQRAWDKYGAAAFDFRIVEQCERDRLIAVEQRILDQAAPEYNVARAAGYRTFLGLRHRQDTIAKMSEAHRGNTRTKGKPRNRSAVEATASAHRGMKRSDETRAKISEAMKGKKRPPRSDECRRKLSEANKGKPKSAEHLAALQAGRARRVYTQEQRTAIAAASKAAWARRKAKAESN